MIAQLFSNWKLYRYLIYSKELIYIYIYIIKLHWQHGVPWLSLDIHPYHPSLLVGLLDHILCPHRADVSFCWLANSHTSRTSIRKHHFHLFFSSSAPHVLFLLLEWLVWREVGDHTDAVLWSVVSRICSRQHTALLCSSHVVFFSMQIC